MWESRWSALAGVAIVMLAVVGGPASSAPSQADVRIGPKVKNQELVDFEHLALASVETTDAAAVKASDQSLRVRVGHTLDWPGITLRPSRGEWNLSQAAEILLDVKNCGSGMMTVRCRADDPQADSKHDSVYGQITLKGGASGELRVSLTHKPSAAPSAAVVMMASGSPAGTKPELAASRALLFGMRGYPVEFGNDVVDPSDPYVQGLDAARVTKLLIFADRTPADQVFEISNIRATGIYPSAKLSRDILFPLVDSFGQYIHRDWPGKIHASTDLADCAAQEKLEWSRNPGPPDWDRYGGWAAGPSVTSTGYFRTQKVGGKWWLVDPDGKLFFSSGVDCTGRLSVTPTDGRADWFAGLPDLQNEFREMVSTGVALKGYYAHKSPRTFSFAAANLERKYGDNWKASSATVAQHRLRSWGMNTLGAWSDQRIIGLRQTPYVVDISVSQFAPKLAASQGYWGRFVDPFDPRFSSLLTEAINTEAARSAADPQCIGYFVDNELPWANSPLDETSLSLATLRCPADQAAKRAFAHDLIRKYSDVASLNRSWGTGYSSWNALLQDQTAPDARRAAPDLAAFYSRLANQYFSTVRRLLKTAAPNHLYLGCRFAWFSPRAGESAARYCDVVSFNLYRRSVADFHFSEADIPVLIGEFHFGALDRGLFDPGLVPTENQAARADAYRNYVRGALTNSCIVGCHWFQYRDEPTTGRLWDGENYQIGLVDIADTPYPETIQAVRDIGHSLYALRAENHLTIVHK